MGLIFSSIAVVAGLAAGISVGSHIFFAAAIARSLEHLDESHDDPHNMRSRKHGQAPIDASSRMLGAHADAWTYWPDYQRTSTINRIIKRLWPSLTSGIISQSLDMGKVAVQQNVFDKFKFVEDIVLGSTSLCKDPEDYGQLVEGRQFDLGSKPPRIGGIKAYRSSVNEASLETSLLWGSDCKVDVGVVLRVGRLRLWVPLTVTRLCLKADARLTMTPIVDPLPCLGGMDLSLLSPPSVDFSLKLLGILDIMAIPLLRDVVQAQVKGVLNSMLIYPNVMSVPLMPEFGLPPPAKGALRVKLLEANFSHFKKPATVEMHVREGRPLRSSAVEGDTPGNPVYEEDFCFIVDNFETQRLHLRVTGDDSLGWGDNDVIGVGSLPFATIIKQEHGEQEEEPPPVVELADFVKSAREAFTLELELHPVHHGHRNAATAALSHVTSMARAGGMFAKKMAKSAVHPGKSSRDHHHESQGSGPGTVKLQVSFIPFDHATAAAAAPIGPTGESAKPKNPPENDEEAQKDGILTIKVIRGRNLVAATKGQDLNSYVHMVVDDDDPDTFDIAQVSRTVYQDPSPYWGETVDFVLVKPDSVLNVTVFKPKGNLGTKLLPGEDKDKSLGRLHIPIRDVVLNGRVHDNFTLLDSENGTLELALEWTSI